MNEDKKPEKVMEKIDKHIESIEARINTLLEDIDIEMLTPAERLNFAIKLQGQLTRFLSLRKSSEPSVPEGQEKAL